MLIGQDFEYVRFELFGYKLQEPNGFIGNTILFISSLIILRLLSKYPKTDFFKFWRYGIFTLGLSFFVGGFGHLLFQYYSHQGKIPSWYISLFIPFFIEIAMISILSNEKWKRIFKIISFSKLIVILIATTALLFVVDLEKEPQGVLKYTTIHTTLGLFSVLVGLAIYYARKITPSFYYFVFSVLVLIPAPFIQRMKINPHLFYDRNDLSHTLVLVSLIFYYYGIKKYAEYLSNDK